MKDYYKILEVEKNALETEIKKAFRKKALIIHPDKSSADTKDQFVELFEAYEILSNKKTRDRYNKLYDLFFTEATEIRDEKLRTDLKQILEQGQVYAGDFDKFNREVLTLILLRLFLGGNYFFFAALACVFFGVWTAIRGLTLFKWDYSLIGVGLAIIGLILAKIRIDWVQKNSR